MFITVHAALGAAMGERVNNPALAFALGFASHFLLDAVPHGDEDLVYASRLSPAAKKQIKWIKMDSATAIVLTSLSFGFKIYANPLSVAFGVFGAVLPDILIGLYELSNMRHWQRHLFRRFQTFHHWCHNHIIRWQPNQKIGFTIQLITFIVLVMVLL